MNEEREEEEHRVNEEERMVSGGFVGAGVPGTEGISSR